VKNRFEKFLLLVTKAFSNKQTVFKELKRNIFMQFSNEDKEKAKAVS